MRAVSRRQNHVAIERQYRNMAEGLAREPRAVAYAQEALRRLGRTAKLTIVRGGTDGSRLTEMGLPTPNLSCGGHIPRIRPWNGPAWTKWSSRSSGSSRWPRSGAKIEGDLCRVGRARRAPPRFSKRWGSAARPTLRQGAKIEGEMASEELQGVPPPAADAPPPQEMTSAELAEAKRYGRLGLFCSLADKLIDVVYLTAAVLFLAGPMDGWLQGYPALHRNWSLRLVALFLGSPRCMWSYRSLCRFIRATFWSTVPV